MENKFEITVEGLDAQEAVKFLDRKSRKFQSLALDDIENVLNKNTDEFKLIRKIFLDYFNDYTRSVVTLIFGDIEK